MINLNKLRFAGVIVLIVAVFVSAYFTNGFGLWECIYPTTEKYFKETLTEEVFENTLDTALNQTDIYPIMFNHMTANTSGKTPMLLFIGYDGCVANAVHLNSDSQNSGLFNLVSGGGGIYLAKTGGENVGEQRTSTAPGWATVFTGVWGSENGVVSNGGKLNEDTPSIIYSLGAAGVPTAFNVSWTTHFDSTYNNEIKKASANNYPISYCLGNSDEDTFDAAISQINGGQKQAIFSILEYTDHSGHGLGFSIKNPSYIAAFDSADKCGNDMINAVKARATYANEDWLIIIASDHGGSGSSHGGTTIMESTVFFASNKKI